MAWLLKIVIFVPSQNYSAVPKSDASKTPRKYSPLIGRQQSHAKKMANSLEKVRQVIQRSRASHIIVKPQQKMFTQ